MMPVEQLIAILLVLAVLFSWVNERFLRIPPTIGLMLIGLAVAGLLYLLESLGWGGARTQMAEFMEAVDFRVTLMDGVLGFLLFAGALHIDTKILLQEKWSITVLAVVSTLLATLFIGTLTWLALGWMGMGIDYIYALIFGALIAPTDPIAAVSILKHAGMPKRLETLISGESLFNDGVAAVLFAVLVGMATGGHAPTAGGVTRHLVQELIGGAAVGGAAGYLGQVVLRNLRDGGARLLTSVTIVVVGGVLSRQLHVSNPIAMVVAGLVVGAGVSRNMDEEGRLVLVSTWSLIEDVINAVIFMLIGLLAVTQPGEMATGAMAVAIVIALLSRFVSVAIAAALARSGKISGLTQWKLVSLLTWGGLRGAVSVALVLSLPNFDQQSVIVDMSYAVIVFSLVIQGLTVGRIFSRIELNKMAEA